MCLQSFDANGHVKKAPWYELKRSTAIPADFDAIDGPDGTFSEDDDPVDQMQNLHIDGLGTENNEAIDEG